MEPGTGVLPALPEGLTVEPDGPLESVEGPPADGAGGGPPAVDSGGPPAVDSGGPPVVDSEGLPEDAGGLLVGGGTLTVEVPGSDTLISGAPDEDVAGKETLIEGAPVGDAPSSDTLTRGAFGADPSGSDTLITEVCSSDRLTSGVPDEDTVEELDEAGACALAYPAVSSAVHRPASSPTAPAPTHRGRGLTVRPCSPWWGMESRTSLGETNDGASRFDVQLDLVHDAGHQSKPSAVLGARVGIQDRYRECPTVMDDERQAVDVGDNAQGDQPLLVGSTVPDRIGHCLVDGKDEFKTAGGVEAECCGDLLDIPPCHVERRSQGG